MVHTSMQGPEAAVTEGVLSTAADRGLIPRVLGFVFERMDDEVKAALEEGSALSYECNCSYLQIYNEHLSDLLRPDSTGLVIREDRRGAKVEGAMERPVSSAAETYSVFCEGNANRAVGVTLMNAESSRSHSVFTLRIASTRTMPSGATQKRTSSFYLVDLAGSERQKHTDTQGQQLKEASAINRSLSALGNTIKALTKEASHVPYRDSKLTFLLKNALGGNARTTMVACVSPAEKCVEETLSTLKFAQRAKLMKNRATADESMVGDVRALQDEIKRLRAALSSGGASAAPAQAAEAATA